MEEQYFKVLEIFSFPMNYNRLISTHLTIFFFVSHIRWHISGFYSRVYYYSYNALFSRVLPLFLSVFYHSLISRASVNCELGIFIKMRSGLNIDSSALCDFFQVILNFAFVQDDFPQSKLHKICYSTARAVTRIITKVFILMYKSRHHKIRIINILFNNLLNYREY